MDLSYERRAWTLIYLCLGVIEGGTAAVMVRSLFGNAVAGIVVDLVLAVVSAAPAWANLASLVYARRAQGRPKISSSGRCWSRWRSASEHWRCYRSAASD